MLTLPAGPLKRIHIDKAAMASRSPAPIIIRLPDRDIHCRCAWLKAESAFRFEPATPLPPAGTYAWMETYGAVLYEPA